MSGTTTTTKSEVVIPEFKQIMGHPAPLWMLFMTEFWERFAFYGIRWALVLYIVTQFFQGNAIGEQSANLTYGSYLALVYAGAVFGGYVADKVIGYQRSILVGAVFMAAGLFAGHMFKPNISTMVGKLYSVADTRRDSGFTIFYMGINAGAFLAPILTQYLAQKVFNTGDTPAYKIVFFAAGIGMLISLVWFYFGRSLLKGIGAPEGEAKNPMRVVMVAVGALFVIPVMYLLLKAGANFLQWILMALFAVLAVMLMIEGIKEGKVARDKTIAMMIIFAFNILFWAFFEQAGSSFTFLAENIVNREGALSFITFGMPAFPTAWFQSVNSVAVITCAPIIAWVWVAMAKKNINPSIPRKFGLGILFNAAAFGLLWYALTALVDPSTNKIPFWTLFAVYWVQSVGELCLSPIGLSMVTKLAPTRLVGLGMGGWFLSTGIGNNLSGIIASLISGEKGMSVESALTGYTQGFWILTTGGVILFLLAPFIEKLMHGVK